MNAGGGFYLAVDLPGGGSLVLDVVSPREPIEFSGVAEMSALPAESLVVIGPGDSDAPRRAVVDRLGGGVLLVSRELLWSILDPRRRGTSEPWQAVDSVAAEQMLRREGRFLWRMIAGFCDRDPALRSECRSLLAQYSAGAGALWDRLEELSCRGGSDPFAGWVEDDDQDIDQVPLPDPPDADPEAVSEWLADPANLSRVLGSGYTPRIQQSEMAGEVGEALRDGHPLLLEAGTGVGKTLGYLVPLLARIDATDERAVVSTFTRTLQNQILDNDLPSLAPLFPALKARLLMGRSNYLCRRREIKFRERPIESLEDAWTAVSFRLWMECTEAGLREEVDRHPALKAHLGVLFDSPEPCSPSVCHGKRECFVQKARRLAREARLVIVNHSLLMNDFAAGNALIGPYTHLVVDEAHRLPAAALDTFSVGCDSVRPVVIEELVGDLRSGDAEPVATRALRAQLAGRADEGAAASAALGPFVDAIRKSLAAYRRWLNSLGDVFEERLGDGQRPQGKVRIYVADEAFGSIRDLTLAFTESAAASGAAYAEFSRRVDDLSDLSDEAADLLATHARAAELMVALEKDVRFMVSGDDENWVYWLDPDSRNGIRSTGATRLESGSLLRECWLGSDLAPILTSATLGVGDDFSHMIGELGVGRLANPPRTSLIPSPFDFDSQSLFVTSPGFPTPEKSEYLPALAAFLRRLTTTVPRKTLVLFTAYHALQFVARAMADENPADELFPAGAQDWLRTRPVVLAQGQGRSPGELVARFRRERHAVLLGTNTFWEGVDFPGEELEVLVVTKLPFQVPTDPWVEARCGRLQAQGENPFATFTVRDAVLRLRQGIGRLIRSDSDRGAVVLLDSRLHAKSYGITFLNALPTGVHYCNEAADIVDTVAAFFEDGD